MIKKFVKTNAFIWALAIRDESDVVIASFAKAMCKQHIKMRSQAAIAHSSAKKGNE